MELVPLTEVNIIPFLERFQFFGDGTISRLDLQWQPEPSCKLTISAMDFHQNARWVEVVLFCERLDVFYWYSGWRGSIQCAELFARFYDGIIYVAVSLDHDAFDNSAAFKDENVSMLLKSGSISYLIRATDARDCQEP